MLYKTVGRIKEQISAIGIGCWGFGGDWDTSNDRNADAIIRTSIELGINLFDVAPVYGWNHSERVLGKTLKDRGLRHKVIIASKCGLTWGDDHVTANDLTRRICSVRSTEVWSGFRPITSISGSSTGRIPPLRSRRPARPLRK